MSKNKQVLIGILVIIVALGVVAASLIFRALHSPPSKRTGESSTQSPFLTPQPLAQTTPSPTPSLAPSWQTYTNKEIGFSFEYPANWQYEESTFPGVSKKNIRLSFQPVNFLVEVNASASLAVTSHAYDGYELVASEKISVGKESAKKRAWQTTAKEQELYKESYKAIDINFSHANNQYTIYINYKASSEHSLLPDFEHILSSFQFLDIAESKDNWQTYSNKEVGYALKYPTDWQLEEVNINSQEVGGPVKYIKIYEPQRKYFLYFGLKKSGQDFFISDRTGIGAGDIQQISEKTLKILNIPVLIEALKSEGRAKEYFFHQPSGTDRTCHCQFIGGLSPSQEEFLETPSLEILDTPIKILTSVSWQ